MRIVARPEIDPKTPLAERLRQVRRNLGDVDRDDFANLLGISKNTLAHYERGERTPDADVLLAYHGQFFIDLNWLVSGEGEMHIPGAELLDMARPLSERLLRGSIHKPMIHDVAKAQMSGSRPGFSAIADLDQPGMIAIPRYDEVRPSAGPGSAPTSETLTTRVAFERHWLKELGVQTDAAVILPARGDSMEPTILDGAPMLVDTSKTDVQNGYIYVIAVENDLLVKRIRRRLDGRIDLISDNRAYEPETLDAAALKHLRVIGRVYAAVSKL
jgi:phage repressor protein C with HTH and peptisase S24 domain